MLFFFRKLRKKKRLVKPECSLFSHCPVISGFIIFLLIVILLAPAIHEKSHMLVLDFYNCEYSYYITEKTREVTPYCGLETFPAIMFLGAGIGANSLLSLLFLVPVFFLRRKRIFSISNIFILASLGFASDMWLYLFSGGGDIHAILTIIGFSGIRNTTPLMGIVMTGSLAFFIHKKLEFMEGSTIFSGISVIDEID